MSNTRTYTFSVTGIIASNYIRIDEAVTLAEPVRTFGGDVAGNVIIFIVSNYLQ